MAPRSCALVLSLLISSCGGSVETPKSPVAGKGPAIPPDAPLVIFLGDSITAGLHLSKDQAFPSVLQRELADDGVPFRLVNAGVSGDTTSGGRARLDWLLKQEPAVVVVELGANDGFRGVPVETMEANLRDILERVKASGAKTLLLRVPLPPNYGPSYTEDFARMFGRVAEATGTPLVGDFMDGVGGRLDMNLPDGIHPNVAGHRRLAGNLRKALRKLLD
jgi:acyl-CoA thioesterase-1